MRGVSILSGGTSVGRGDGVLLFPGRCVFIKFSKASVLALGGGMFGRKGSSMSISRGLLVGGVPNCHRPRFLVRDGFGPFCARWLVLLYGVGGI